MSALGLWYAFGGRSSGDDNQVQDKKGTKETPAGKTTPGKEVGTKLPETQSPNPGLAASSASTTATALDPPETDTNNKSPKRKPGKGKPAPKRVARPKPAVKPGKSQPVETKPTTTVEPAKTTTDPLTTTGSLRPRSNIPRAAAASSYQLV